MEILSGVVICAICIVGLTQVIKNFIDDGDITTKNEKKIKGWVWTIVLAVVSVVVVFAYEELPPVVIMVLLSLSAASLFYDTVYKGFQAIIKSILKKNGGNDECGG